MERERERERKREGTYKVGAVKQKSVTTLTGYSRFHQKKKDRKNEKVPISRDESSDSSRMRIVRPGPFLAARIRSYTR